MKKTTLLTLTLVTTFSLHATQDKCVNNAVSKDLVSPGDSTKHNLSYQGGELAVGGAYGIHPNYRLDYAGAYQYVEGIQRFSVLGSSFSASFRLSNERFISGQPSYFRLSYNGAAGYRGALSAKQARIAELSRRLGLSQDSLSAIEGRLSYVRLKQYEWEQRRRFGLHDSLDLPEVPGLPGIPDTSALSVPSLSPPEIGFNDEISHLESLRSIQLSEISQLTTDKELALGDYKKFQQGNYTSFLEGIKRFDLGMTSLSASPLSNNAVPVNGVNLSGEWRKGFYSVASGFSLPNQLFSSQAFDQLIGNSGNVFNVNDFFAVRSVRFVSSTVVGYGRQEKNSISVGTFYSGRSLGQIRKKETGQQSLAVTLSGVYTPAKFEQLSVKATISQSMSNDSSAGAGSDRVAYSGEMGLKLPKLNGLLKARHRNLGTDYDGWSQGILIRGAQTSDLSYRQKLRNVAAFTFRAAYGNYSSAVTPGLVRKTRQGGIDGQFRLSKSTSLTTSYTLLESAGDTLSRYGSLNHLGFAGITDRRSGRKWSFTSSADLSAARIQLVDSTQQLVQAHLSHRAATKDFYFGVKLTYLDYTSVGRVSGTNVIVAPEAGVSYKGLKADLSYQVLSSEQFGSNRGFVFSMSLDMGSLFTFQYTMQRWLPTDYVFFLTEDTYLVKPLYINAKLILHLK